MQDFNIATRYRSGRRPPVARPTRAQSRIETAYAGRLCQLASCRRACFPAEKSASAERSSSTMPPPGTIRVGVRRRL